MSSRSGSSKRDEFESIERSAVPSGRKSKHQLIVKRILREVDDLRAKRALKIPRSALGSATVEHIRAALSRASAKKGIELATSTDDDNLYIWRQE